MQKPRLYVSTHRISPRILSQWRIPLPSKWTCTPEQVKQEGWACMCKIRSKLNLLSTCGCDQKTEGHWHPLSDVLCRKDAIGMREVGLLPVCIISMISGCFLSWNLVQWVKAVFEKPPQKTWLLIVIIWNLRKKPIYLRTSENILLWMSKLLPNLGHGGISL